MESICGRDWITGRYFKKRCFIKGEPLAVFRVIYKDKEGKLIINHKGKRIEVKKVDNEFYEV